MDEHLIVGQGSPNERALAYALKLHIESCDVCSGPDDGCSVGQSLESICIDDYGFSPYELFVGKE